MRHRHLWGYYIFAIICCVTQQSALASNCPSGDSALAQNTPLSQLCPNGFTSNLGHDSVAQAITNNQNNAQMISAAAQQQGVPVDLALAASYQESHMQSCAGSNTGVRGPMQLTISTGNAYGYNRNINSQNINGGIATLKAAINTCGTTNFACISAHYNGSTATQQRQWAQGVKSADNILKGNNVLLASACSGNTGACKSGGALPTLTTPNNSVGTPGEPVTTPQPTTNSIITTTPLTT